MRSHVNCPSYLPSSSHSSLFSWSDYSLHFQLMPQPRERESGGGAMEKKLIFRLSSKCGLIVNEVNNGWMHGRSPRDAAVCGSEEAHLEPLQVPRGCRWEELHSSQAPSEAVMGEKQRKQEGKRERENKGERALAGRAWFVVLSSCSAQSFLFYQPLKEILCHTKQSLADILDPYEVNTLRFTPKYWINDVKLIILHQYEEAGIGLIRKRSHFVWIPLKNAQREGSSISWRTASMRLKAG